jgi:hypothetical protein
MRYVLLASILTLAGCDSLPVAPAEALQAGDAACTQDCQAHLEQCPQIFAGFPERGAVECPAAHADCLKSCAFRQRRAAHAPAAFAAATAVNPPASSVGPSVSKEARLRELKRFHDQGLVTDDVYTDRQKAILSEP